MPKLVIQWHPVFIRRQFRKASGDKAVAPLGEHPQNLHNPSLFIFTLMEKYFGGGKRPSVDFPQ